MTQRRFAAIVLAGGHGRRAGGPKALKKLHGQPLWRAMSAHWAELGALEVIAVLHPDAMPEQPDVSATAVTAVTSVTTVRAVAADPDAPMFVSLQRGLQQLTADRPVFVHPVDAGLPTVAVVQALQTTADLAVSQGEGALVHQPFVTGNASKGTDEHNGQDRRGRHGHPVLLEPQLWRSLLSMDPQSSRLDRVLAELQPAQRIGLLWDDPAVLANYNADGIGN